MILVLQGFGLGSLYRWGNGAAGPPGPGGDTTLTGKLVHPILTHHSTITTSWWWLALLSALGGR